MSKTILITGASSGIGKATAALFADRGWNVVATMRNPKDGADFADRSNVLVTPLDLVDSGVHQVSGRRWRRALRHHRRLGEQRRLRRLRAARSHPD